MNALGRVHHPPTNKRHQSRLANRASRKEKRKKKKEKRRKKKEKRTKEKRKRKKKKEKRCAPAAQEERTPARTRCLGRTRTHSSKTACRSPPVWACEAKALSCCSGVAPLTPPLLTGETTPIWSSHAACSISLQNAYSSAHSSTTCVANTYRLDPAVVLGDVGVADVRKLGLGARTRVHRECECAHATANGRGRFAHTQTHMHCTVVYVRVYVVEQLGRRARPDRAGGTDRDKATSWQK